MAINIHIKVVGGKAEYRSSDEEVDEDGNIWLTKKGQKNVNIHWRTEKGETWTFKGINIYGDTEGDIEDIDVTDDKVSVKDKNTKLNLGITYKISTSAGDLDPKIINRGGGG